MSNTMNLTQVAKAAGKSRATIYNWLKDGKIPVEAIEGSNPPIWPAKKIYEWLGIDVDESAGV